MKYIGFVLIGLILAVLALMVYVRLAPTDATAWHDPQLPVMGPGEYPSDNGFVVQRLLDSGGMAMLAALDGIIRATPRTQVVAGSVEDAHITYVTRTRIFGYPDFTTVRLHQLGDSSTTTLQVYGRARFGKYDMGVNKARIQGWMAQLNGTTE